MSENGTKRFHFRYFNLRARGEPVRWLLKAMEIEYTEETIPMDTWASMKSQFDFGKCPVLVVDGIQLHQTSVICKYLALTHDLAPSDYWHSARLEEVAESVHDISESFALGFLSRMRGHGELAKHLLKQGRARVFEVAKIVEKNIGEEGWIRSEKMTWVDIFISSYMDTYGTYFKAVLEDHPNLKTLVERIRNIPAVKAWISERPPLQPFEILDEETLSE